VKGIEQSLWIVLRVSFPSMLSNGSHQSYRRALNFVNVVHVYIILEPKGMSYA
jgi:hypothetical protein